MQNAKCKITNSERQKSNKKRNIFQSTTKNLYSFYLFFTFYKQTKNFYFFFIQNFLIISKFIFLCVCVSVHYFFDYFSFFTLMKCKYDIRVYSHK